MIGGISVQELTSDIVDTSVDPSSIELQEEIMKGYEEAFYDLQIEESLNSR